MDPALLDATHVFLRIDAVRRPLVAPYEGPFPVLSRSPKTFVILRREKHFTVSVDRLKPAAFLPEIGHPGRLPGLGSQVLPGRDEIQDAPINADVAPSPSPAVSVAESPPAASSSLVDVVPPQSSSAAPSPALDPDDWPLPTRYGRRPRPPDRLNI